MPTLTTHERRRRRPAWRRWPVALALLLLGAQACNVFNPGAATATPEASPFPTQPVPTTEVPPPATATPTAVAPAPTDTAAPTTVAPPTASPTTEVPGTPTVPSPDTLPPEAVLISMPGNASSITSPVHVAGEADSTFEQNLVVQITGADNNVIATVPTTIQSEIGQRGPFAVDVPFSVSEEQPGRISVFHSSARDGGLLHLSSVEVTLLPNGTASINPGQTNPEAIVIFEPAFQANVSGGTVHITGYSMPVFENTLNVALCGEGGSGAPDELCGTADNLLATGIAMVQAPDIGQPGPFETDLDYSISSPMAARVLVYAISARDGGIIHLSSREIMLAP